MATSDSLIQVKNLKKHYHRGAIKALDGVTADINKGDVMVVIGPSGSGKSTFLRSLNLLEEPTDGEIIFNGVDITKKKYKDASGKTVKLDIDGLRQKMGMVFQHFNLFPHMTILDNMTLAPMKVKGISKEDAEKKALELLEIVGLADRAKAYPAQLSGGQKQRVAIARALASDPQILLCDEATSALDPQTTSSILELLQDINQKFGITIVIITHQMSVVREICTHVAIMKDGEVKEQGLVEEIFSHPKSQVAKELISKDSGNDVESKKLTQSEIQDGEIVRIVFSENSAFEPVIANLILTFHEPVNILKANTKNVGGVAKGEMILQFMSDSTNVPEMKKFLTERGLEIGEAN